MSIHRLSVEDALASLGTTTARLASQEAARRLQAYGLNRVEKTGGSSPVLRLLKSSSDFSR
jgi:hypothetical protein